MSTQKNGGSAFPGFNYVSSNVHDGMTLRDYFAAKAMQGMLAAANAELQAKDFAEVSYLLADAMLKARQE